MTEINIRDLKFKRGNFHLDIAALNIKQGERIAVLGKNGCGKSTLLETIIGLNKYSGEVFYDDLNLKNERTKIYPKLAYCFQNPDDQLFCETVKDDILFAVKNFDLIEEDDDAIFDRIEKHLPVKQFLLCEPHTLSYGEKRLVAFATALATNPQIFFFDEPFTMLDHRQQRGLTTLLANLHDKTLIIATHDYDKALKLATRFLVLHEGKIAYDGGPEVLNDEVLMASYNLI